jgi:hypothetical protein
VLAVSQRQRPSHPKCTCMRSSNRTSLFHSKAAFYSERRWHRRHKFPSRTPKLRQSWEHAERAPQFEVGESFQDHFGFVDLHAAIKYASRAAIREHGTTACEVGVTSRLCKDLAFCCGYRGKALRVRPVAILYMWKGNTL